MSSVVHYMKFGKMYENVYYAGTLYSTHLQFLATCPCSGTKFEHEFLLGAFFAGGNLGYDGTGISLICSKALKYQ